MAPHLSELDAMQVIFKLKLNDKVMCVFYELKK